MDKAVILGAGTYGQVYAEYIREQEIYEIVGFLDDDKSKIGLSINGISVLGSIGEFEFLKNKEIRNIFAPIGNNEIRVKLLKIAREKEFNTPCFIHKDTIIHSSVNIGTAVYVLPGTNIMPLTTLSDYTMVSMGVNIAHHVKIAEGCFLSQGSNIGASIDIAERTFVGIAATIMTGVKAIGKNTLIGAGSVVIRDVPDHAVVAGNPAKILRYNEKVD